jgi:hypothetical protein
MPDPVPTRMVTFRSVTIGLLGVVFICGLTPFNNFVLANTFLVGNLLPVGLLLFVSIVVLLLNGLLRRFLPGRSLSVGELSVVFGMTLVSCTLPSGGLMQWLPGHLVGLFIEAQANPSSARTLDTAMLADWVFPDFASGESQRRGGERIVTDYIDRNSDGVVPFAAWLRPALAWGVLAMLVYTAMAMLMLIVRRQWQDNERLTFPLADVYATLLESPEPGRCWPAVFRSKLFWSAAVAVFVLHLLTGIAQWFPKVPSILLAYNLTAVLSEPPFNHLEYGLKQARIYLVVVGISYFISSRVSFSIVFFYLAFNLIQMTLGTGGVTKLTEGMQRDQTLGTVCVMMLVMIYVGRAHWLMVARLMFGRGRVEDDRCDVFGSYAVAGWVLLVCIAGATAWLTLAGASVMMSLAIVIGVLTFWLMMARLAAESGLIYAQIHTAPMSRALTILSMDLPLMKPSPKSFMAASLISSIWVTNHRENAAVFASSAMVTISRVGVIRRAGGVMMLMLLALAVGFVVSGASTLWCEYQFAATLDAGQASPLNANGVMNHPKSYVVGPLNEFFGPAGGPIETHPRLTHVGIGAAATTLVSLLYLRFASFPLHPIGVLTAYSFPVQNSWLGIFVGWAIKALITRFGGAGMYRAAKPFFLGLIFGEMAAVSMWIVVNSILAMQGISYRAVNLLAP